MRNGVDAAVAVRIAHIDVESHCVNYILDTHTREDGVDDVDDDDFTRLNLGIVRLGRQRRRTLQRRMGSPIPSPPTAPVHCI